MPTATAATMSKKSKELPSSSFHHDDNDDDNNSENFYEDLPPQQIWMVNSSTASSVVSPLPDRQPSPVKSKVNNKFNSQNLIASGHVWMGGLKLHSTTTTTTRSHVSGSTTTTPVLCTPDSTQTTDTQEGDDLLPVFESTTLGITAAPFYGVNREVGPVEGGESAASTTSSRSSSISSPHHQADEEPWKEDDEDDDLSSSIPSFSTRRIILDLQDELARTKAELARYQNKKQNIRPGGGGEEELMFSFVDQEDNDDHESPTTKVPHEIGQDDSSDIAVVPAVPAKTKFHTIITSSSSHHHSSPKDPKEEKETDDDAAAAVWQVRWHRSEQRVTKLSSRLKETNDLARRLHGTLQRVKDRMQQELLPYQYYYEDVRFMRVCANLLLLALFVLAPYCLVGRTEVDLPAFALVVAVTFCAVEIAVRS
jgi:hypothetical protein